MTCVVCRVSVLFFMLRYWACWYQNSILQNPSTGKFDVLWFTAFNSKVATLFLTRVLILSPPQGENPIYKSAVTTVVNPKYEGKWWSFSFLVTTLYEKEHGFGLQGGAGFCNALTVCCCCSHQMIAMHFATISVCFTYLFFLYASFGICTVCKCFLFSFVELERMCQNDL